MKNTFLNLNLIKYALKYFISPCHFSYLKNSKVQFLGRRMTKGITLILSIPGVYNAKLEINYMMNRLLNKNNWLKKVNCK